MSTKPGELQVAVRTAAGADKSKVGTKLMSWAFKPDEGPLHEMADFADSTPLASYDLLMPSTSEDVLRAVQTLTWRGEPATSDGVAVELGTTREDVVPALMAVRNGNSLTVVKRADGTAVWALTMARERAIADA